MASWESSVSGQWPDFPEVTATLEHVLHERFPGEGIGVIYLCGQDHFRYAARAGLPGVAVVTRAGRAEPSDAARTIYAVPTASDDPCGQMSSTQVREALKHEDLQTLRSCLHPAVLAMRLRWRSRTGHWAADGAAVTAGRFERTRIRAPRCGSRMIPRTR